MKCLYILMKFFWFKRSRLLYALEEIFSNLLSKIKLSFISKSTNLSRLKDLWDCP